MRIIFTLLGLLTASLTSVYPLQSEACSGAFRPKEFAGLVFQGFLRSESELLKIRKEASVDRTDRRYRDAEEAISRARRVTRYRVRLSEGDRDWLDSALIGLASLFREYLQSWTGLKSDYYEFVLLDAANARLALEITYATLFNQSPHGRMRVVPAPQTTKLLTAWQEAIVRSEAARESLRNLIQMTTALANHSKKLSPGRKLHATAESLLDFDVIYNEVALNLTGLKFRRVKRWFRNIEDFYFEIEADGKIVKKYSADEGNPNESELYIPHLKELYYWRYGNDGFRREDGRLARPSEFQEQRLLIEFLLGTGAS